MSKEHILIVEDEEDILELVKYNLTREGYSVTGAVTGEEALKVVASSSTDLIILDLMLPGIDGLDVAKKLKENPNTRKIPIIMLTAKGEEVDIVTGLELGADDYLTKPFSPRILLARVRAVLRRHLKKQEDQTEIMIDGIKIHLGRRIVQLNDKPVDLTFTEFELLVLLAKKPGWVFTRSQIVDAIHGVGYAVTERSVDVQIVGLRKKLGELGNYIETVRSIGYRFKEIE
ncbi:MAG: response regulator transcription factor [Desulfobacterales bacterium]|nr:response regulator transcription factor [Desulfobacterales bacterium]